MASFVNRTKTAIASLIIFQGLVTRVQAQSEMLTLNEALRLALDHNRTIEQSRIAEQEAADRIDVAKTQRLPQFKYNSTTGMLLTKPTVTFDKGTFGTFEGIGPVPATDTTITSTRQLSAIINAEVALPLTQQYRIGLQIKQLQVGRKIAQEQVRLTRQEAVQQVRETYYAILQAQSSIEAVEKSLALYRDLAVLTARYVKAGTALDGDLLNVNARLADAEFQKAGLQGPLATQKERLNQLLGRQISTEFRVAAAAEASWIAPELDEARDKALASRPEIEQARLKIQQAVLDKRIKKSEYIPNVSLSTSYFSMVNVSTTLPSNVAIAGVQMSWEPFDWGRKRKEISAIEKSAHRAEIALADAEDKVRIEVGNAYRNVEQARLMIAAARASEGNAREAVRLASVRFRYDAALLNRVLEAESGVASANERVQKAVLAYWSARAELERAIGEER